MKRINKLVLNILRNIKRLIGKALTDDVIISSGQIPINLNPV